MGRDLIHLMHRLFLPAAQRVEREAWQPLVDVYQAADGWLVKYDLAGVRPEDVSLTLDGRTLTVRGARRDCCVQESCSHYHMEIAYSRFERSLVLPEDVAPMRMTTEFRDGMLLVRLQRGEARR